MLTPETLRQHANADPNTVAWAGQAKQLLLWAADLIEAAEAAITVPSARG